MSSRTAAGRKRLATADDRDKKEKSTSKGFFFKKKNAKAPIDAKAQYLAPSPKQAASAYLQHQQEASRAGSETNLLRRTDYDHSLQPQYTRDQSYQSQFQSYNSPPSPISDSQSQYHVSQGQMYIEASYQPPPPSRTYPSQQTVSYAKSKAAQSSPTLHSPAEEVASSFPPPPSYVSPSPSVYHVPLPNISPPLRPSASPQGPSLVTSSLSRVSSPAPSELPAYSNSHNNDFATHIPRNTGRITAADFPQASSQYAPVRPQHQQYLDEWNPPPPPPIPAAARPNFSPNLRAPIPLPAQNVLSFDSSHAHSNEASPLQIDFSPQRRHNVAESIKSVSTKSISSVTPTPTPNTFIFPGGRSGGRPKISSKTSNPNLPSGRSQGSGGKHHLDPTLYDRSASPAPTTSSGGRSIRLALADNLSEIHITPPAEPSGDVFISEKRAGKMPAHGNGTFIHPSSRTKAAPHRPPILLKSKSHSSTGSRDYENRRRFLGIPLKTKRKGKDLEFVNTPLAYGGFENSTSVAPLSPAPISLERVFTNRVGEYPLDPHDPIVLDNDRRTGELLSFINSNSSPSFFNYGNVPPSTILDLGCGQGHWMVDAAIAWKGYGTRITGLDMVDLTKGLLPWAVKQGVTENINFVKGNFLTERLPFDDNSFELVRLSCLSMCIASNSWPSLLQEVSRVLMAGGRLELIDDLILFPYGKKFAIFDDSASATRAELPPRLDISVPSARFTTFNVYNHEVVNPGLGLPITEKDPSEVYKLYGVEEEEEANEEEGAAFGHLHYSKPLPRPQAPPKIRPTDPGPPEISAASWDHAHSSALDMEAVFEHMLANKFGIQKDINDFLLEMMIQVFGHARLLKTMHLAIPPPEARQVPTKTLKKVSSRLSSHGSGLVLWPSTFIPMDQPEVDIHASKNLRLLLATRKHLVEHALEATNDDEIDEGTVLDAIWEYESFLRHRFTPSISNTSDRSDTDSFSSDYQQDVWEIQSEFREHFAWGDDSGASLQQPANPMSPLDQDPRGSPVIPLSAAPQSSNNPVQARGDRTSRPSSSLFPREELTHIRTFRVYEAIKINGSLFASQN